jgi:DNA mismatch endonuclease, patch repair protein
MPSEETPVPVDPARSRLMSRVRGRNTKPEMVVRRLVHAMGYRHRLHRRDLPGTPDLVFPARRKIVFVHGCFWHRHPGCRHATSPKTRQGFWEHKFQENVERDRRKLESLVRLGWQSLVIWSCETSDTVSLEMKLRRFLEGHERAP